MTEELIRIKWGVCEHYWYPFCSLISLYKAACGSYVHPGTRFIVLLFNKYCVKWCEAICKPCAICRSGPADSGVLGEPHHITSVARGSVTPPYETSSWLVAATV